MKTTSFKAFSLLEASIVLCIVGIALSLSLPSLTQYAVTKKNNVSIKKLEKIQNLLSAYVYEHGCLPNPSQANINIGISAPHLSRGIIPFSTLGISENDAKDAFQRFYSYIVQQDISCSQNKERNSNQSLLNFCNTPQPTASKSINIKTSRNTSIGLNLGQKNFIAYVLIFHGKSGGGSLNDSGFLQETPHLVKRKNSLSSTIFQECGLDKTCDDHLLWITRNNLVTLNFNTTCAKIIDEDAKQAPIKDTIDNDIEDPR